MCHLTVKSAKKRTLIYNSAHFFRFFLTSIVNFSHFGPLWGAYWGIWDPGSLVGALRVTMSSLTAIATLTPGLVQQPV